MFKIDNEKNIQITRGDRGTIKLTAKNGSFSIGDIIKFSIVEKKDYSNVVFQKEYTVTQEGENAYLTLTEEDTRIGEVISKPVTYWYEIEYNEDQTPISYDEDNAKQFILYPEAPDKEGDD